MDKGWRPFLAYATLGSGTLAAWNTLITTSDFFQQQYPVCGIGTVKTGWQFSQRPRCGKLERGSPSG